MHHQDLNSPPTEDELDQLEAFLHSSSLDQGGLSLEGADGLMCATAVGPDFLKPSEWLHLVLGDAAFETEEEANQIAGILFRRWNQILQQVKINPVSGTDGYIPIVDLGAENHPPEDRESRCGWTWADGFIKGMSLRTDDWDRFFEEGELSKTLAPIMLLHAGTVREVVDEDVTHERRKQMIFMIPRCTHLLWNYWHRDEEGRSPAQKTPVARSEKIGRNDPCFCGSGKKYKKCCLH
jgi:uncharacterized protein